jgi:hypothetical protein
MTDYTCSQCDHWTERLDMDLRGAKGTCDEAARALYGHAAGFYDGLQVVMSDRAPACKLFVMSDTARREEESAAEEWASRQSERDEAARRGFRLAS